ATTNRKRPCGLAKDRRLAGGSTDHIEKNFDGSGLARAVPAEETHDMPPGNGHGQSRERIIIPESLGKIPCLDDGLHRVAASSTHSASNRRRLSSSLRPILLNFRTVSFTTTEASRNLRRLDFARLPFSTYAPAPCRRRIRPSCSSSSYALTTVLGLTTSSSAKVRIAGN